MHPTENDNLRQLKTTFLKAFEHARKTGQLPAAELPRYEQVITQAYALRGRDGSRAWRRFRRRVAFKYWREQGRQDGLFDWDIDWTMMWEWFLDNIVPLIKIFIMFLPLFLEDGPDR